MFLRSLLALVAISAVVALPTVYTRYPPGTSRVRVYENTIPPRLFKLLEQEARTIAAYEQGYNALKDGKKHTRWLPLNDKPRTALELAAKRLFNTVKPGPEATGCEWWVQLVDVNEPIGFHLDKDESIASNQYYLVHPIYGTIVYLSDIGGATLIFDQFSPNGNGYEPAISQEGELVYPKKNKYVVFQGHLLHGVLPGEPPKTPPPPGKKHQRLTFLMNWWKNKPAEPNCYTLNHSEVPGLKVYSDEEMAALVREIEADGKHSPKRVSLPIVDLTEGSHSPYWVYEFKLPGGQPQTARLPTRVEPGGSYSIKWHGSNKGGKTSKDEL